MFYLLPSVCLVPHFLSVRFRRRPLKNLSGTRRSDVFLQAVLGLLPRFIFAYILFMLLDWFRALFRTTVKRPAEIEVENNMLFFVFSCLTVWKLFWHVIMTRHVHTYRAKVVKTSWQNRSQKVTNGRQFYLLSLGSTGVETENDEEQFKADIKTRYFFSSIDPLVPGGLAYCRLSKRLLRFQCVTCPAVMSKNIIKPFFGKWLFPVFLSGPTSPWYPI